MKVSDVIRELELDGSISPKTIHILGNMMADVAWCKQGIKQQFECYAELFSNSTAMHSTTSRSV
jgi:predicted transcriptional regulator